MAFDAAVMFDRIGVGPGWRCLDLGCGPGPGGVIDVLRDRVGPSGHIVGLDADAVFIDHARSRAQGHANVDFVLGNAYRTGLPDASFDLVHVRFVAGTAGEPGALLQATIRLRGRAASSRSRSRTSRR